MKRSLWRKEAYIAISVFLLVWGIHCEYRRSFSCSSSPPTILSVSPSSLCQKGDATVVLTGTGFSHVSGVFFDGTPALAFTGESSTRIVALVPPHAEGIGGVSVENPCGSASLPIGILYYGSPKPSGILPAEGCTGGGGVISVFGTGFTEIVSVSVGGANTSPISVSPTEITVQAPAGTPGAADVEVITTCGSGTLAASYIYYGDPTILSLGTNYGCFPGGDTVDIWGQGFYQINSVSFGSSPASAFTLVSSTLISATTPASGTLGSVDVSVAGTCGNGLLASGFTYTTIPLLEGLSPTNGCVSGGTEVSLSGSQMDFITQVTFNGQASPGITRVSGSTITAITPVSITEGAVDVAVYNACGSDTLPSSFNYFSTPSPQPGLEVNSVSPTLSCTGGGITVSIQGSGLTGTTSVSFGGILTPPTLVLDGFSVSAIAPAHPPGTVDISLITGSCGFTTLAQAFTYVAPPSITDFSPITGCQGSETAVYITGSGFSTGTQVYFGIFSAKEFTILSDTLITATTPTTGTGNVYIKIANPCSIDLSTMEFAFTSCTQCTSPPVIEYAIETDPLLNNCLNICYTLYPMYDYQVYIWGSGFTGVTDVWINGDNTIHFFEVYPPYGRDICACTNYPPTGGTSVVVETPCGTDSCSCY